MRGFRALAAAFIALGLIGACESAGQPTFDPQMIAAVAPACSGQPVSGAGSVVTTGAVRNHMVLLDTSGQPFEWTDWIPAEWRPASTADTELVACVNAEPVRRVIEVCPYYGSDITRYEVTRTFAVIEPFSGRSVANFSIVTQPRSCERQEDASLTELVGTIDSDMVTAHLTSLVERGVFVDPDAAGGSFQPSGGSSPPAGSSSKPATSKPSVGPEAVELRVALKQGLISATGTGDGLEHLDLELTSKVDRSLSVTIEAGTMLDPHAQATQSMVVVSGTDVELGARATDTAALDVACVQMHQDQPTGSDSFTVRADSAESVLAQLLDYPQFTDETTRVQQFAVWTITSNPRRGDYVPLGTQFDVFGTGPTDDELASISDLFVAAGLDPSDYKALR
jgi:hypothetical protein